MKVHRLKFFNKPVGYWTSTYGVLTLIYSSLDGVPVAVLGFMTPRTPCAPAGLLTNESCSIDTHIEVGSGRLDTRRISQQDPLTSGPRSRGPTADSSCSYQLTHAHWKTKIYWRWRLARATLEPKSERTPHSLAWIKYSIATLHFHNLAVAYGLGSLLAGPHCYLEFRLVTSQEQGLAPTCKPSLLMVSR